MNKWNRLLAMLDQVLGFPNKKRSTVRKVSQDFDEKTNEHVYLLEYRIRVGESTVKKKAQPNRPFNRAGLLAYLHGLEKIAKKRKKRHAAT